MTKTIPTHSNDWGQGRAPFWVIWNSNGDVPMQKYLNRDSAIKAAKALSANHIGGMFYVLESVYSIFNVLENIQMPETSETT